MRHTFTILLGFLLLLAWATGAEAQCSKRILVYLDVSGSMLKAQGREESPYERTLNALERLLQDPNFLESRDIVQIAQFGQTITASGQAVGPSQAMDRLRRLRKVSPSPDTNFEAVFTDLLQILADNSQYDRQVIIIASDFVHDPASTPPQAAPNLADWSSLFSRRKTDLTSRFSSSSKIPLVLFRSPASGWEATVRDQVLKDLSPIVPSDRVFDVGAGGSSAEQLAAGIKRALLFDLDVKAELKRGHLDDLAITVKNLNCIPVDLASVNLICPPVNGAPQGASIPVQIGAGQSRLERRGSKDAQILEIPKSTVPCGDDYEVSVQTVQGATGSTKATNRTWMKYQVEKVLFEENLLHGSVAHLILGLQGLYTGERSFGLTLEAKEEGERARVTGTISAPRDLDPETIKTYRITIPVSQSVRKRLLERREVNVRIDGAQSLGKSTAEASAEKEESQSWTNLAQLTEAPFMLLFFLFSLLYKRSTLKDAMGYAAEMGDVTRKSWLLVGGAATLIGLAINFLRLPLVRTLPLSVADGVKEASIFLALFFGISLSLRALNTARLVRDVYGRRLHNPEKYAIRVKKGWHPWLYGLLIAATVWACVHFFTPKSEGGPIAEIQSLDVVPD